MANNGDDSAHVIANSSSDHTIPNGNGATNGNSDIQRDRQDSINHLIAEAAQRARARRISDSGPENAGVIRSFSDGTDIPHADSRLRYYQLMSEYHRLKSEQKVVLSKLCPDGGHVWENQPSAYQAPERYTAPPETLNNGRDAYIDYAFPGSHAAQVEQIVWIIKYGFDAAMESLPWNASNVSSVDEATRKNRDDRQQAFLRDLAVHNPHLLDIYEAWEVAGGLTGMYLIQKAEADK